MSLRSERLLIRRNNTVVRIELSTRYLAGASTCVAERRMAAGIVGGYLPKPDQPRRGSHVANALWLLVFLNATQDRACLTEDCLANASHAGFRAMQFNYIVSTNTGAVKLWTELRFAIIGTIPERFGTTT